MENLQKKAKVVLLKHYRDPQPPPDTVDDTITNMLWDRLKEVVEYGYEWREMEQIDEIAHIIEKLRPLVEIPYDVFEFNAALQKVKDMFERTAAAQAPEERRKFFKVVSNHIVDKDKN